MLRKNARKKDRKVNQSSSSVTTPRTRGGDLTNVTRTDGWCRSQWGWDARIRRVVLAADVLVMGRNVLKMLVAFCFHFVSFSFFPPFSYQTYGVMYTSASDIRSRERRQKLDWVNGSGMERMFTQQGTSGRVEREKGTRFLM